MPKTTSIKPKPQSLLPVIEKEIHPIVISSQSISITNEQDKSEASSILSSLALKRSLLKEDKENITKPILTSLNAIRAKYKPLEDILDNSIDLIRQKMSEYQTKALKQAELEKDKIIERMGEGRGKLSVNKAIEKLNDITNSSPVNSVATDNGSVSFRTDTILKITDIKKIPIDYYELNEAKLLRSLKAGTKVDGAELETVQTVVTKIK